MSKLDNVRISLKIDDLSNWNNSNIILNNGEVALIRLPNDQVKIKVGDGSSYISTLNYLNEQEFFTSKISANNAEFGFKNYAQRFSVAEGQNVSAYGTYQHAAGYNVEAISGETLAFVWNGKDLYGYDNRYKSHGPGSFSINPLSGLSGFYIGEKHLEEILYNSISNEIEPLKNSVNQNIATLNNNIGIINQATNSLATNFTIIDGKVNELSQDIENKILIDGKKIDQFEVKHIARDDYYELVNSEEGPLSNTIYIISSDSLNAYDQKIENVADGEKDTDAVNLGQLKNYSNKDSDLKLNQINSSTIKTIRPEFDGELHFDVIVNNNIIMSSSDENGSVLGFDGTSWNNTRVFNASYSNQTIYINPPDVEQEYIKILNKDFIVNLNNQWKISETISEDENYVYESFSNKGIDNSYATTIIKFKDLDNFNFQVSHSAENGCDYVKVFPLDTLPDSDYSNAYRETQGLNNFERSSIKFTNIQNPKLEHFVYVVYCKDVSVHIGNDCGYLYIPKDYVEKCECIKQYKYDLKWYSLDGTTKNYIDNIVYENNDLIYVNYETLCNLKDTGKLITGKTYCLTDYYAGKEIDVNYKECYLNGDKEHRFDILITAMSPNTLSEHCKTITYDNKEYEIWYSLKDETERFDYPDIFERGIIYRMIDENNNDLPYDFKSILINSEYSIDGNDCSNIKVEQNIIDEKISMNFCQFFGNCFNIKVGQHCYSSRFTNSSNIIFGNYCQENDLQNTNDITFGNYCSENILYNVKQIKFESNCILNTIVNSNNICFNFNCRNNWIGDQVGGISNEDEIKPTYNISIDSDSNNIYIGNESYNINIGKQCSFILFGCGSDQLYHGTHNVNVNNDVSLVKFFELPEDKQLQNIEIKSGIHSKDIYVTYENMLYREVLSTIAPKGAYNLTI